MPCSQIYDCRKGKERKSIYTALFTIPFIIPIWQPHQSRKSDKNTQCLHSLKALRHISHSFTCKLYHVCHSFVSIHQMAPPLTWGSRHPVAAYYSSIDPEGMRGWVGLVGWPIADSLPTYVVNRQLQISHKTVKVRPPKTDVLPLCHETNCDVVK